MLGDGFQASMAFVGFVFGPKIERRTGFGHRAEPVLSGNVRNVFRQLYDAFAGAAFTREQPRLSERNAIQNRPLSFWCRLAVPLGHIDPREGLALGNSGCRAREVYDRGRAVGFMLLELRLFAIMGGNLRAPAIIIRSVIVAHGLAACLEGGPNCRRSIILSSCAHCIASSTLQAFCLSAMPMVSSVFEISLARAVAARSTCIRYSLSPLVSPSFGLPWLAGFGIEVIVIFLVAAPCLSGEAP